MLNFISIEEVKTQCRIDPEDNTEDTLLQTFAEAAEQTVQNLINRDAANIIDEYTEVPAPVKTAMLILSAQYYKYREATTQDNVNNVPWGVQNLLLPYTRLTDMSDYE